MAECSLSTGRMVSPAARAAGMTIAPAITSVSLLAMAGVAPSPMAASVGASPAAPTMPLRTMLGRVRCRSSVMASGPASNSVPGGNSPRRCGATEASAMATAPGRWRRACSASSRQLPPAPKAQTSSPSSSPSTSSVCRPMLPVQPKIANRLLIGKHLRMRRGKGKGRARGEGRRAKGKQRIASSE